MNGLEGVDKSFSGGFICGFIVSCIFAAGVAYGDTFFNGYPLEGGIFAAFLQCFICILAPTFRNALGMSLGTFPAYALIYWTKFGMIGVKYALIIAAVNLVLFIILAICTRSLRREDK